MIHSAVVLVKTSHRCHWVDISRDVQQIINESGFDEGVCLVASLHTTAAMTINENGDPDVETDFFSKLGRMIPQDPQFLHAEGNSDSHIKTSLVGLHVQVPVVEGKLVLGVWQSIYFCEFDGPRSRQCMVTLMGL